MTTGSRAGWHRPMATPTSRSRTCRSAMFSPAGGPPRAGVAIGDHILDLPGALAAGLLAGDAGQAAEAALGGTLNALSRTWWTARGRPCGRGSPRSFAKDSPDRHWGRTTAAPGGVLRAAPAGRNRRLHRLLCRHPPRDQHRQAVPAGQPAAAELQAHPDRLPWPGLVGAAIWRPGSPAEWPDEDARCCRSGIRTLQPPGLRAGAWRLGRSGQRARRPAADRSGGGPYCRLLPAERLVRPRHAGLGIPAARPVPVQELHQHRLVLDRDAGGAGAVPHPATGKVAGRSAPVAVSAGRCRPIVRRVG